MFLPCGLGQNPGLSSLRFVIEIILGFAQPKEVLQKPSFQMLGCDRCGVELKVRNRCGSRFKETNFKCQIKPSKALVSCIPISVMQKIMLIAMRNTRKKARKGGGERLARHGCMVRQKSQHYAHEFQQRISQ